MENRSFHLRFIQFTRQSEFLAFKQNTLRDSFPLRILQQWYQTQDHSSSKLTASTWNKSTGIEPHNPLRKQNHCAGGTIKPQPGMQSRPECVNIPFSFLFFTKAIYKNLVVPSDIQSNICTGSSQKNIGRERRFI